MTDEPQDSLHLRADARRNRRMVLDAAREAIAERGLDAPLEEIARRAGVGIATLYRRFPDRAALIRAVVHDNMAAMEREVELAEAKEADPWQALARVVHAAVARRIGVIVPLTLPQVRDEFSAHGTLWERRAEVVQRMENLLAAAQCQELVRRDIGLGDIVLGLVKLSRPVPGMAPKVDDEVTRQLLAIYLDGLQATSAPSTTRAPRQMDDVDREFGL